MATKKELTEQALIGKYMNYVMENEHFPSSIYKFCKEEKIKEEDFYKFFGSFDTLKKGIWKAFHTQTISLLHKNKDFENYTNKNKLLSYYFTMFEMLTLNRSYVLFVLKEHDMMLKNLEQLKGLRKHFKDFTAQLVENANEQKNLKILKQPKGVFSEAAWFQFMFLLRFWVKDDSPAFEKTDAAIEKSVNTAFDVFDNTPLESIVDFGKFLWKEQMA
ncbi:TetR family transcriptional regulator C-terminal domain-containing protein [Cytophaga sp. FL35]|uniref:TetR family transcriptional regulator C-terminal domain-containing protein n=1 Tax=Cytophaga sp. FL35 TaxID=1904456 RepID=UPI0016535168|nr:TetR family transcriptional regulator C-terminal domain-containing protein [Cytophaga sp. FL35]MBC6999427.1 TetR/AcrR family transcriptional regulator [Cytophaga sp. FL35]